MINWFKQRRIRKEQEKAQAEAEAQEALNKRRKERQERYEKYLSEETEKMLNKECPRFNGETCKEVCVNFEEGKIITSSFGVDYRGPSCKLWNKPRNIGWF